MIHKLVALILMMSPAIVMAGENNVNNDGSILNVIISVVVGSLISAPLLIKLGWWIIEKVSKSKERDKILDVIYQHGEAGMALLEHYRSTTKKERKKTLDNALKEIGDVVDIYVSLGKDKENKDKTEESS